MLLMKKGDKGLRTFYQALLRESWVHAGSSELELQQEDMIQERESSGRRERFGGDCCYHRLPAPKGTPLQL